VTVEHRAAKPEEDHRFRVEVTFAAAIETPDHLILGRNVVDFTLAFHASMPRPPRKLSDEEINQTLAHHIGPVIAAVQTGLTSMGYAVVGSVDEPMAANSSPTGAFGKTSPVTVSLAQGTHTGQRRLGIQRPDRARRARRRGAGVKRQWHSPQCKARAKRMGGCWCHLIPPKRRRELDLAAKPGGEVHK
jgi:hypothetical protein